MERTGENRGELRTARYDPELMVEAYQFQGVMQAFPGHFHEHYVVGFIERGKRNLRYMGQDYLTAPGDLLLFNPGDNHACEGLDGQPLDYRCINIGPDVMKKAAQEMNSSDTLPVFRQPVVFHCELVSDLRELHMMILRGESGVQKEERFYLLLEQLLRNYAESISPTAEDARRAEVREVCDYLAEHLGEPVSLDTLGAVAGLSKYHLLRAFTKGTGITPYSYLETLRIDHAKAMLKRGISVAVVAQESGFSDQSHLTNAFKRFIGLTPGQYQQIFAGEDEKNKGEPDDK